MDKLTKWGYFILYIEEILAENLLEIYIREIFTKHKAPMKIISNQDLKFILAFWECFTAKQKT